MIAFTPAAGRPAEPLTIDWFERWERSGAKFPPDLPPAEQEEFARRVRQHPQFQPAVLAGSRHAPVA